MSRSFCVLECVDTPRPLRRSSPLQNPRRCSRRQLACLQENRCAWRGSVRGRVGRLDDPNNGTSARRGSGSCLGFGEFTSWAASEQGVVGGKDAIGECTLIRPVREAQARRPRNIRTEARSGKVVRRANPRLITWNQAPDSSCRRLRSMLLE